MAASRSKRRAPASISTYGTGTRFEITADRAFRWQIDGDVQPKVERLTVDVLPAFARLIVARDGGR